MESRFLYDNLDDYGVYVVLWNNKRRDKPRLRGSLYIDETSCIPRSVLSVLEYFKELVNNGKIERFDVQEMEPGKEASSSHVA